MSSRSTTIGVEVVDPAVCDAAEIDAALRAARRAALRLDAYQAVLVAELKKRRTSAAMPLARDLLLGDVTRSRASAAALEAAADALTKVPGLGGVEAPIEALATIGRATRHNPHFVAALGTPEGHAVVAQAATTSPDAFAAVLQQFLAKVDRNRGEEEQTERARYLRRSLKFFHRADNGDAAASLAGPHDEVALLQAAIDQVRNERWCAEYPQRSPSLMTRPEAAQLNFDALIAIARRVLGDAPTAAVDRPAKNASAANRRTAPAIVIIADLATDTATTIDGFPVPKSTVERLSCSANLYALALGGDNAILNLAKTARYASHDQYMALLARDRTCSVKACRVPGKYTTVHHLVAYPLGPTDIDNLTHR